MKTERLNKISELKLWITNQIKATPISEFPRNIEYHEQLEDPVYKVNITVEEQDFFIDKKGVKWVKQKE